MLPAINGRQWEDGKTERHFTLISMDVSLHFTRLDRERKSPWEIEKRERGNRKERKMVH
jgi:hypothetical protein